MSDVIDYGYAYDLIKSDPRLGFAETVGKLLYDAKCNTIALSIPKLFMPIIFMDHVDEDLFEEVLEKLIVDNPTENSKLWCCENGNGWKFFVNHEKYDGLYRNEISFYFMNVWHDVIVFDRVVPCPDDILRHHVNINFKKEK